MNLFGKKSFAHGIHPPELKDNTSGLPIRQFPFAPTLVIPLSQHIGQPAIAVVKEGQEVTRGQCIAEPDGFVSVPMHAPSSGVVRRVGLGPNIDGQMTPAVFLEPFPASTQERPEGPSCELESASPQEIIRAVQQAGIVGLGGAGFPTHAKMSVPDGKYVDTLIINGAECEPCLTADHRVMLEHAEDVILGTRYLLRATGATRAVIGIESNKQDAADVLSQAIPGGLPITVEVLPVKYPQGAAEMLIKSLLGREKPQGARAADIHTLVFNVTSTSEIGRLLPHGAGLQERVITISGPAVCNPGNYRIPIGTPIRFVLESVGVRDDVSCVFLGGPMMGQAVSTLDIPVMKNTLGVIAMTEQETGRLAAHREFACIRCAACVDACPMFLNPAELGRLAAHGEYERMASAFHLSECFECGCCSYVCPSHIPLVHRFRVAKTALGRSEAAT